MKALRITTEMLAAMSIILVVSGALGNWGWLDKFGVAPDAAQLLAFALGLPLAIRVLLQPTTT